MILTSLHWVFVFWVIVIIVVMGLKRDPLIPCLLGLFSLGWLFKGSLLGGLQTIFYALAVAGNEFLGIILIIALIVGMSKLLTASGADYLIMRPAAKLMLNAGIAYWVLGLSMLIVSWFVWPSPAVALIGAIMLPVAVKAGLPVIGAAMSMNLFGHGIALSTDYIIQGAPNITAKAAGFTDPGPIIHASIPLAIVMGLTTTITAFFMIKRDMSNNLDLHTQISLLEQDRTIIKPKITKASWILAIITPIAFLLAVFTMLVLHLKGGDATALIGGTAVLILILGSVLQYQFEALEKITDFVRDGFMFGIKIFAPVIIIAGFFFLGKSDLSQQILGQGAPGFLEDIGIYLSKTIPLSKGPIAIIELLTGIIVGLDGSGFSPLPLVGSLAGTFGKAANLDTATLAALGQLAGVWTGGGTIIPWGLIPVAAIAGVNPIELARRNFWPVMIGFTAATITAIILL